VEKAESRGKAGYLEIKRYAVVPDVLGYPGEELLHFASSLLQRRDQRCLARARRPVIHPEDPISKYVSLRRREDFDIAIAGTGFEPLPFPSLVDACGMIRPIGASEGLF
jgi:hypothetical protein